MAKLFETVCRCKTCGSENVKVFHSIDITYTCNDCGIKEVVKWI